MLRPKIECPDCAGAGFCPGCKGDGLVMEAFTVDRCAECHGFGRTRSAWCRSCGGSGRYLMYEELVACQECIGDGSCVACEGKGVVT